MNFLKKLVVERIFNNILKNQVWDKLDGKKTYVGIVLYFTGVFLASTDYAEYSPMLINAGKFFGYTGGVHKADKLLKRVKDWLTTINGFMSTLDELSKKEKA